ncbi:hypothetical protein VPH35_098805 [Triticum aestivum]
MKFNMENCRGLHYLRIFHVFCILGSAESVSSTTGARQVQGFCHARASTGSDLHLLSRAWDPQPLTSRGPWLVSLSRVPPPASLQHGFGSLSGCVCANHLYETTLFLRWTTPSTSSPLANLMSHICSYFLAGCIKKPDSQIHLLYAFQFINFPLMEEGNQSNRRI